MITCDNKDLLKHLLSEEVFIMAEYLDEAGLAKVWSKVQDLVNSQSVGLTLTSPSTNHFAPVKVFCTRNSAVWQLRFGRNP